VSSGALRLGSPEEVVDAALVDCARGVLPRGMVVSTDASVAGPGGKSSATALLVEGPDAEGTGGGGDGGGGAFLRFQGTLHGRGSAPVTRATVGLSRSGFCHLRLPLEPPPLALHGYRAVEVELRTDATGTIGLQLYTGGDAGGRAPLQAELDVAPGGGWGVARLPLEGFERLVMGRPVEAADPTELHTVAALGLLVTGHEDTVDFTLDIRSVRCVVGLPSELTPRRKASPGFGPPRVRKRPR